jgi:hypothetical protein
MLKKLAKGNLLDFSPPAGVPSPPPHNVPDRFVYVPHQHYYLDNAAQQPDVKKPGKTADVSKVKQGNHPSSTERNFIWLPYMPGYIAYTGLQPGVPIITGKMTGCWLVIFTMNGQTWFGHIGTKDDPNTPQSIEAKNAWTIARGTRKVQSVKAFRPTSSGAVIIGDATFGALSAHGNFYVINCTTYWYPQFIVEAITKVGSVLVPTF